MHWQYSSFKLISPAQQGMQPTPLRGGCIGARFRFVEHGLARLRRWQAQRLRRLSIIVTMLCVELTALTLLYLGCGVFPSLGIAAGAGAAYLAFPSLLALVVLTVRGLATTTRVIIERIRDRRTYQFSLRSLLLVTLLISIVCAWYGPRVRAIRTERRMLEGKWQRVNLEGKPIIFPTGKPIIVEFSPGSFTVDPNHNPKWLDFHTPRGTSHAIYRWEGTRLRVMRVSVDAQRPKSFDQYHIVLKPGAGIGTYGISTHFLERLPSQPEMPTN